jgi:AcrR family transcriptional regulator
LKREATVARILETTERLLNSGVRFIEIPVEQLLTEAGVSRSTFYVHFADKSALLAALAERCIDEVMEATEVWWGAYHDAGADGVVALVQDLIKAYRRNFAILRNFNEVGAYDEALRNLWRDRWNRSVAMFVPRLLAEQSRGRIAPEIDVTLTVKIVSQMADTAILDHLAHGSVSQDRALAVTLGRIAWLAYYGRVPERNG